MLQHHSNTQYFSTTLVLLHHYSSTKNYLGTTQAYSTYLNMQVNSTASSLLQNTVLPQHFVAPSPHSAIQYSTAPALYDFISALLYILLQYCLRLHYALV